MGNRSKSTRYKYMVCNNSTHVYNPKTDDSVCQIILRGEGEVDTYTIVSEPPGREICLACLETMTRMSKRTKKKRRTKPYAPRGSRFDTDMGRVNGFWRPDLQDINQKARCETCREWFTRKLAEDWKRQCYNCYSKKRPRQTGNQATQQAARLSQLQNAELEIVRKAREKI